MSDIPVPPPLSSGHSISRKGMDAPNKKWFYILVPICWFFISNCALSAPGGYVPLYALGVIMCLMPIMFSCKWAKYVGVLFLLLYVGLIVMDIQDGKKFHQQRLNRLLELQEKQRKES